MKKRTRGKSRYPLIRQRLTLAVEAVAHRVCRKRGIPFCEMKKRRGGGGHGGDRLLHEVICARAEVIALARRVGIYHREISSAIGICSSMCHQYWHKYGEKYASEYELNLIDKAKAKSRQRLRSRVSTDLRMIDTVYYEDAFNLGKVKLIELAGRPIYETVKEDIQKYA